MKKLFHKSELWFAIVCIILYVVGSSAADRISEDIGVAKSITLAFHLILSVCLFVFLRRNQLCCYFGLCKSIHSPARFLFYVPLAALATVNIWFGVQQNMPAADAVCYVGSMLLVGFLEELIFRGLLFQAMRKSNEKSAVIVSSILFGIGHIVNLFNGSGTEFAANLCQVFHAAAVGFLFVTIFCKGGSLWPCIFTHSVLNALSAFVNETAALRYQIPVSVAMCVIAMAYAFFLWRKLPSPKESAPST